MNYPLISKWLPNVRIDSCGYIDPDTLERELANASHLKAYTGPASYKGGMWIISEIADADSDMEALLIGARPIVKERNRELTEAQVRKAIIMGRGYSAEMVANDVVKNCSVKGVSVNETKFLSFLASVVIISSLLILKSCEEHLSDNNVKVKKGTFIP